MARKSKVNTIKPSKKRHNHSAIKKENVGRTSFWGKIGSFFSEALKAPEESKKELLIVEQEVNSISSESDLKYEIASHLSDKKESKSSEVISSFKSEEDNDFEYDEEDETESKNDKRGEILGLLNEATSKWKESGDTGLHLEPPKSWSERMRGVWSSLEVQSSRLSGRLKILMKEVSERVAARQRAAKEEGKKVESDVIVREEWQTVLEKLEKVSTPSERDEIEKIYKQLENL